MPENGPHAAQSQPAEMDTAPTQASPVEVCSASLHCTPNDDCLAFEHVHSVCFIRFWVFLPFATTTEMCGERLHRTSSAADRRYIKANVRGRSAIGLEGRRPCLRSSLQHNAARISSCANVRMCSLWKFCKRNRNETTEVCFEILYYIRVHITLSTKVH